MNLKLQTTGASRYALLALLVLAAILPGVAMAADDARDAAAQIERDARRMQEEARRQMAESERTQREALRSQEQSIRRMEESQQRMEDSARERTAQAREEQGRSYTYIYPAPTTSPDAQPPQPGTSATPPEPIAPRVQPLQPIAPAAQSGNASFGGMELATVSDRLGDYFGVSSGVLVVRAGGDSASMLQDGDVILSIDGRVPTDAQHAARILRSYQVGERVKLRVQRDRRTVELDTTAPGGRGN